MKALSEVLKADWYDVALIDYPSRKKTIQQIVKQHMIPQLAKIKNLPDRKVSFVTHSMWGIVLRHYLNNNPLKNLNRVVMLTPPNRGSKLASKVSTHELANRIMWPVLKQLSYHTDKGSAIPNLWHLDHLDCELWVITVDKDFSVQLKEAKVTYMDDYVHLDWLHSFVMYQPKVFKLVKNFLANGKFRD